MSAHPQTKDQFENLPPAMALRALISMLMTSIAGAAAALLVLPIWLPHVSTSLLGSDPKGYWYLSRVSALVAYVLIWLSMALGLGMTNRLARAWPGGPTAFELHQHTGLLGLGFALFHALVLLGDRYMDYTIFELLIPFASTAYRPLWVGLGQIGLYVALVVALSFFARRMIGRRLWRAIHYLSFAVFLLALAHGLLSGTDTSAVWARGMYLASGGSVLFLTLYRLLSARSLARVKRKA